MAELWGEPGGLSTLHPLPGSDPVVPESDPWPGCAQHPSYKPPRCRPSPSRGCHPDQIKKLRFPGRIKPQHPPGQRLLPPWRELGDRERPCGGMRAGSVLFPAQGMCHPPDTAELANAGLLPVPALRGCARSRSICRCSPCQRLGRVGH